MVVQPISRVHITGEKRASLLRFWSRDEFGSDPMSAQMVRPMSRPRSSFETVLAACEANRDPEFHDGWQPVRARTTAELSKQEMTRS